MIAVSASWMHRRAKKVAGPLLIVLICLLSGSLAAGSLLTVPERVSSARDGEQPDERHSGGESVLAACCCSGNKLELRRTQPDARQPSDDSAQVRLRSQQPESANQPNSDCWLSPLRC